MAISLALRFQILRRDNFVCFLCKRNDAPRSVRFIVPIMFGGIEDPTNLAAICDNCGGIKADLIPDKACA